MIDKQTGDLVPIKFSDFFQSGAVASTGLTPEELKERMAKALADQQAQQAKLAKYLPKERQGPILAKQEYIDVYAIDTQGAPYLHPEAGIIEGLGNKELTVHIRSGDTKLAKGALVLVKGHPFVVRGVAKAKDMVYLRCLPVKALEQYRAIAGVGIIKVTTDPAITALAEKAVALADAADAAGYKPAYELPKDPA